MKKSASLQARFSRFMISLLFVLTIALSVSWSEEAFAATTSPAKVTLSSVIAPAYNKVTVKWKKTSNVTSYNVYYKESGVSKWTKIANVGKSNTSYTHTSSTKYKLTPGKTYYYTVRGYNSKIQKSGSYNKTGLKVVIPGKPSKVTITSVKADSYNKVTVKWKKVSNASSYRIYYKASGASKWTKLADVSGSKTSYTHKSSSKYKLTPGKKYYYTVKAYNKTSKTWGYYDTTGKAVTIPKAPTATPKPTATPTPKPTVTPTPKPVANPDEMAKEVFRLTNIEREKVGVPPLTYNEDIQKVAMLRAKEISTKFSHERPNGEDSSTAFYEFDICGSSGENIAKGPRTAELVVKAWMTSPGHKAAILRKDNIYLGVGFYQDKNGTCYWSQNFARKDPYAKGKISFDANGGKFADGTTKIVYTAPSGKTFAMADAPTPTKDGYKFVCWMNKDGDKDLEITIFSSQEIVLEYRNTFTAQWQKIE